MASRGINKCIVVGNLGDDPVVRYTQNNEAVASFSVATSESWKDKNSGQQKEITEWHRCVAYRRLAEVVGEYLKKGSKVYIEGKLQTRKWQAQDGTDRYTTEIVVKDMQMLDGKAQGDQQGYSGHTGGNQQNPASNQQGSHLNHQAQYAQQSQQQAQQSNNGMPDDDFSDDIPFS